MPFNMKKNLKIVWAFSLSAIVAILFITAATVVAELNSPFKDFLKDNFMHHWIGKGVLAAIIWSLGGLLVNLFPFPSDEKKTTFMIWLISLSTIVGFLIIFLFYLYEGLLAH